MARRPRTGCRGTASWRCSRSARRTGMYLNSDEAVSSPLRVRAPQTTMPAPGNARSTLTPLGLSWPETLSSVSAVRALMPAIPASQPGGRLPDPARGVDARHHPRHGPARRQVERPGPAGGLDDLQARVVDGAVLAERREAAQVRRDRGEPGKRTVRRRGTRARPCSRRWQRPARASFSDVSPGRQRRLKRGKQQGARARGSRSCSLGRCRRVAPDPRRFRRRTPAGRMLSRGAPRQIPRSLPPSRRARAAGRR